MVRDRFYKESKYYFLLLLIILSFSLKADNWQQFQHDPWRSGFSPDVASSTSLLRWQFQEGGAVMSSPAVVGDTVFVGSDSGYIFCLKAITSNPNGELKWKYYIGKLMHLPVVVNYGRVFVGNAGSDTIGGFYIFCLDANPPDTNGILIWKYYAGNTRNGAMVGAVVDSLVFGGCEDISGQRRGTFYCLKAFPSPGDTLYWKFEGFAGNMFYPAVAYDRVYLGMEMPGNFPRSFLCLKERPSNPPNAETLWTYPLLATCRCAPAVADSKAYVGIENGRFYCFNALSNRPETLWTFQATQPIFSSPAIKDGMVFVGSGLWSGAGSVYAFGTPAILDVGVDSFPLPDTVGFDTTIEVKAWVKNYGTVTVTFPTGLWDTSFSFYQILTVSSLQPNEIRLLDFGALRFRSAGTYLFVCSTALSNDENPSNDCQRKIIVVRPPVGIVNGTSGIGISERIKATVMTVSQFKSKLAKLPSQLKIYTPTGQKADPKRIDQGIYFLKIGSKNLKILIIK